MERKDDRSARIERPGLIQSFIPSGALKTSIHRSNTRLFPLAASRLDDLQGMLKLFRIQIEKNPDLVELSQKWFDVYQKRSEAAIKLMLVGSSQAEVLREVDFAASGVAGAVEKGSDWQTPSGSYFSANPLGKKGSVCLVYPGAFNSYVGLGRDLFRYFPQIVGWMSPIASDLDYVFCTRYLYPPDLERMTKDEVNALEACLLDDAVAMMTSGMAFSVVYTFILERFFKIKAESALGYSLGEMSMLFGSGVWVEGDKASAALAASPLFQDQLCGPMNAVREAWGLIPQESGRSEDLWANFVLMAPEDRVREALKGKEHVYLTHVNTPRQVVIGGEPAACQRVIQNLKCSSLKAPFNYALHCDAMKSAYNEFRRLNLRPIECWPEIRLYSSANYDQLKPVPDDIAHRVALGLCRYLDFPRLIQGAYADGGRIFIEIGPGGNCSKWIEDTLRGQPCLAMPVNRKGMDDAASLIRMIARLASHAATVDLTPLYEAVEG
jgi:PfaB family protein